MPSILHLEDDLLDHRLIRATLAGEGLADDLTRVEDADQYRSAISSRCFDLILSDLKLVSFDGMAALHHARATCPDVPFIICSGAMGETAAVDILKAGATDVVLKDRLERLAPAVRRAIRESGERAARALAESALRDSEARLRMMIESVRDYAIFPLDADGRITAWNVGAERLFGYAEHEIVGQPSSALFAPEDRLADTAARELRAATERGSSDEECTHQRRDGTRFLASSVVTPVLDDASRLVGFAKVARDISERRRHEDEVEQAREAAERASQAKDQFLAVLSHELRTPLTPVLTTAQMLERDDSLPARARDAFTLIRRNIELETRLIDDLLDLTRVSRGKMTLNLAEIDVHTKVCHIVEMCRDEARDKGVRVDVKLDATDHHVRADGARVQQVIWNLLKNSIKFTPAGGHVILRTRNAFNDRQQLLLEVQDDGVGIEPDVLPRLFSAFEQGGQNVTRIFGGLGLGLTISKAIVELHEGRLTAASQGRDHGTTMQVSLPTIVPSVEADSADSASPDASCGSGATDDRASCSVLLVEDNADTAGVMLLLLESSGYVVSTADSVASALKAAADQPPDVLVSDIGLPDGSGLDLMRQLRHRQPSIRGVALSGFGMEEDIRRSLAAGFATHVTKPVDIDTLEAAIRRVSAGATAST